MCAPFDLHTSSVDWLREKAILGILSTEKFSTETDIFGWTSFFFLSQTIWRKNKKPFIIDQAVNELN